MRSHDAGGVAGVAPQQNVFEPAVHHARALGFLDHTIVHQNLNLQVSFDAGYRIDHNLRCHLLSPERGMLIPGKPGIRSYDHEKMARSVPRPEQARESRIITYT